MVVGLLDSTSGSISLDGRTLGEDPVAYKRRIGYVPEEPYLYTQLTATEDPDADRHAPRPAAEAPGPQD